MLRRLLALLILGATIFSSAESALALKPDARLHGIVAGTTEVRNDAVAVVWQGHIEDADGTGHQPSHQGEHRHGSAADHCTHAHAVGPASLDRGIPTPSEHRDAISTVVAAYADADLHRALRPPKA